MKTIHNFLVKRIPEIAAFVVSITLSIHLDTSFFMWLLLWIALELMTTSKDQIKKEILP